MFIKKLVSSLWIALGVITVLSLLFFLGFFETWQESLSDKLFSPRTANPDIVLIKIDNKSIAEIGRFPWTRKVYKEVVDKIGTHASSIGIDISFLESESTEVDGALAQSFKKAGNITIAAELEGDHVVAPIEVLRKDAKVGVVNTKPDIDGITRRAVLQIDNKEFPYKHFSTSIAETYLFGTNQSATILDNPPLEDNKYFRINFAGGPETFSGYSFSDVLNNRITPDKFDGKIVLIGATADDLHDSQLVPTSNGRPMAGVEIQAHTIQTLLDQKYLIPESKSQTFVGTVAIVLVLSLGLVYFGVSIGLFVIIVFFVTYVVFAVLSFDGGLVRNLIFPSLAILISGIADLVFKYFSEYKQKTFIRKAFGYYLSEAVLKEVLSDPKKLALGGDRKEISVLFSDIAGFTSISEKVDPDLLTQLLNQYLTAMTDIIFDHKGVLDKYIGDAVMAFWGAPLKDDTHALNACKTALLMKEKLVEIRKDWETHGVSNFGIRIGINTGDMVVGNMGSHMRFDYTLLGDNVNLGSRLEGINKEYGTEIVISGSTYDEVKDQVIARKLDTVAVKGKSHGIVIYELRGMGSSDSAENKFLAGFEEARELYEKGEFKKSLKLFREFEKDYSDDSPTKVYIERCLALIKESPETWDGIFRATSK